MKRSVAVIAVIALMSIPVLPFSTSIALAGVSPQSSSSARPTVPTIPVPPQPAAPKPAVRPPTPIVQPKPNQNGTASQEMPTSVGTWEQTICRSHWACQTQGEYKPFNPAQYSNFASTFSTTDCSKPGTYRVDQCFSSDGRFIGDSIWGLTLEEAAGRFGRSSKDVIAIKWDYKHQGTIGVAYEVFFKNDNNPNLGTGPVAGPKPTPPPMIKISDLQATASAGGILRTIRFDIKAKITGVPQGARVYTDLGNPKDRRLDSPISYSRTEELRLTSNNYYGVRFVGQARLRNYRIRVVDKDGKLIYTSVGRITENLLIP